MKLKSTLLLTAMFVTIAQTMLPAASQAQGVRQRLCINEGWRFTHGDPPGANGLGYDVRPEITDRNDNVVADTKPTEGVAILSADTVLKKWILPSANDFIGDVAKQHARPAGKAHDEISYVQNDFNDSKWHSIDGPGLIVATDNGDPASLVSFASAEREAYFGLVLAIVRFEKGKKGNLKLTASSEGLQLATIEIKQNAHAL